MSTDNHPHDEKGALLTCDVCMKEIPKSVAKSLEGPDYVQYFCGNDCYDKWLEQTPSEPPPEDGAANK